MKFILTMGVLLNNTHTMRIGHTALALALHVHPDSKWKVSVARRRGSERLVWSLTINERRNENATKKQKAKTSKRQQSISSSSKFDYSFHIFILSHSSRMVNWMRKNGERERAIFGSAYHDLSLLFAFFFE